MEIYLDNSATTRQHDEVTEKMSEIMKECYGNPSSLHRMGLDAEKVVKEARKNLASSIGASPEEIFFTSCGTESDNTALFGSLKKNKRKIITTRVEHPAILEPCKRLEEMGYEVSYLDVDRDCNISLDQLKSFLTEDTALISVMAVNNEVGKIFPLKEIAKIRDQVDKSILLHTDAVQALGKMDLKVSGVDLMSASAHKIHGPKGMGMLYVRQGVNIKPYILGGGQEKHFRSGTENVPAIAGFGLAAKMAEPVDPSLKEYLKKGLLDGLDDILINSPLDSISSILNVSFLGTRGEVILHSLEQEGIYVSTGSACSSNKAAKGSHVLEAMGLSFKEIEGAIRFSFSNYNTLEEMDYVLDKTINAVKRFRKLGAFR
ncbi:MAG: cysteine desulfurase [Clostridia bacterium]|nr:cysteine desulfurase [Clostridia bacterium]